MRHWIRAVLGTLCSALLLSCVGAGGPAEAPTAGEHREAPDAESLAFGLPATLPDETVVRHLAYSLVYSEEDEQAKWVAYLLTGDNTYGPVERTNDFRPDPAITTGSATAKDYFRSGYDRGHLAPAGDFQWSRVAMSESFFFSNMSPQVPSFNRGIWSLIEAQVRSWARLNSQLYVVVGPVFEGQMRQIGEIGVTIPPAYFKVLLDYSDPECKGIGFILANVGSKGSLATFAVTIDEVERRTGIDFFPALPDDEEARLESTLDLTKWPFEKVPVVPLPDATPAPEKPNKRAPEQSDPPPKTDAPRSSQCLGTTKAGARCRRTTTDPSGYCWQHK